MNPVFRTSKFAPNYWCFEFWLLHIKQLASTDEGKLEQEITERIFRSIVLN